MPELLPMHQYVIHFLTCILNSILLKTGERTHTCKELLWLCSHIEVNFQKSPSNIIISTIIEERILILKKQYAFSGMIQWIQIQGSQVNPKMTDSSHQLGFLAGEAKHRPLPTSIAGGLAKAALSLKSSSLKQLLWGQMSLRIYPATQEKLKHFFLSFPFC